MAITPASGIPRYHQIAQVLRSRLEAHDAEAAAPFATEHALCREFGVSRTTVRHALGFLKREGLLTSRCGVGTHGTRDCVVNRVVRSSGDPLHGMLKSKPRIVSVERAAAPAQIARFFSIGPDAPVFRLTRLHELGPTPLSVVRSFLPMSLAVGVPRSAWRQPMQEVLWERFGLQLKRSVHTLRVARAMSDIAALLQIGLADPVLRIQASTYDVDGRPVRWTENFFREDMYEYVAEMEWPAPGARHSGTHRSKSRRIS